MGSDVGQIVIGAHAFHFRDRNSARNGSSTHGVAPP